MRVISFIVGAMTGASIAVLFMSCFIISKEWE